jgi:hypothetical protein
MAYLCLFAKPDVPASWLVFLLAIRAVGAQFPWSDVFVGRSEWRLGALRL